MEYIVAKIGIHGAKATVLESNAITLGLTGAKVQLIYDDELWGGLRKKVVFKGAATVEPDITDETLVELPQQVTLAKNVSVSVGITGINADGSKQIPTVWATIGTVKDSAYGDHPQPGAPIKPEWVQVMGSIGDLEKLDTENRENLVAAVNEVLSKVGSGGGNVDLSDYAKVEQLPDSTSDLVNDSGFITRLVEDLANYYAKSETYSREEIDRKISAIPKFSVAVVSALPSENISDTTIYLLTTGSATGDLYSEWIWTNGKWELLGSQRVDLTGYAKEDWVRQQLAGYQPKGNYLTEVPEGYATKEFVEEALADANIGADEVYVVPEGGTVEDAPPGATIIIDPSGEADPPAGDASLNVTGAAVGQTVKIAAVDENGAPTAWEPVDLPSGGGSADWELLNTITLEEDSNSIIIDRDSNGNPFELRAFMFYIDRVPSDLQTENATLYIGNTQSSGYFAAMHNQAANQTRLWMQLEFACAHGYKSASGNGSSAGYAFNVSYTGRALASIEMLRLYGCYFGAGSKIYLYGVRK